MYTQDEFSYFGDDNSDNTDEEIDVGLTLRDKKALTRMERESVEKTKNG